MISIFMNDRFSGPTNPAKKTLLNFLNRPILRKGIRFCERLTPSGKRFSKVSNPFEFLKSLGVNLLQGKLQVDWEGK